MSREHLGPFYYGISGHCSPEVALWDLGKLSFIISFISQLFMEATVFQAITVSTSFLTMENQFYFLNC